MKFLSIVAFKTSGNSSIKAVARGPGVADGAFKVVLKHIISYDASTDRMVDY